MNQQSGNSDVSNRSWLAKIRDIFLHPFVFFDTIPLHGRLIEPIIWCAAIFLAEALYELIKIHDLGRALIIWSLPVVAQPLLVLVIWGLCKLFKGSGSYTDTFRVQAYSNLIYVFVWIPWFGFLTWFYKIVLLALGLARVHRMSLDRAFYAAVFGTLAPLSLLLIVAAAGYFAYTHRLVMPWHL